MSDAKVQVDNLNKSEKKQLDKDVFDTGNALSDDQLKSFCKKHQLEYNEVLLSELTNKYPKKCAFIFTGEQPDEFNRGADHHWLFLYGDKIFDSYGSHDYKVDSDFSYITTHPKQLQEYNSVMVIFY